MQTNKTGNDSDNAFRAPVDAKPFSFMTGLEYTDHLRLVWGWRFADFIKTEWPKIKLTAQNDMNHEFELFIARTMGDEHTN